VTDQELKVLTDIRWALGDNGKRMQSELVEYARQIKKDADEVFRLRERVRDLEADKLDPNGQDPIPLGKPRKTRLGPNAELTGQQRLHGAATNGQEWPAVVGPVE